MNAMMNKDLNAISAVILVFGIIFLHRQHHRRHNSGFSGSPDSAGGQIMTKAQFKENTRLYWYKFSRNKLSVVGLCIVLLSVFFALFAEVATPYPQHAKAFVDYSQAGLAPSKAFICGTDIYGRDIFTRLIFSFRGALLMTVIVLSISVPWESSWV